MNQPRRPENPPEEAAKIDGNPSGQTPNGVPQGAEDENPKGAPNSDRAETETAVNKT